MRAPRTALLALALLAAPLATPAAASPSADPPTSQAVDTRVSVNTRAGLETAPELGMGVNHAIWDSQLGTPQVADLLKDAGVRAMRYPGGSYSDIYHWRDHTAPGGYVAPNTDFDTFMAGVRRAGGQPIVTANYGTGTPQEAADWVRSANVDKGYGVKYWEIGNELYGNGHYGTAWEEDHHEDKSPAGYAGLVRDYSRAMKAVDPSIKIGAVLTTPGEWPDAITAAGDAGSWNQVVLSTAGADIDFVILHWYPRGTNAPDLLSSADTIPEMMAMAKEQIRGHTGRDLGIAFTELNTNFARNTQPTALFAADAYASLLERGAFTVDWWNAHNGLGKVSTVAGQTDYDDFGLLSSANCTEDGSVCQPALNTPFAPYHALALTSRFARPGDQFVAASSTDPLVRAHAARRPDGGLSVLLVNRDPDAAKSVALDYAGFTPRSSAVVRTYGNGDTAITTSTGASGAVSLAPYSITALELAPTSATTGPAAPARPTASSVTDRSAVIDLPVAAPGTKHEVHRQVGTRTDQWGETTGGSFTATNLSPGTEYTVNVIARDNAGRVSWSSPPLVFRTTAPASSTCAVKLANTNDWGNGWVGDVQVTNTGTTPVDGWVLAFDWPTTWQKVDSGWSGAWAQSGRSVTVTADAGNRLLAPGATVSTGFVGSYQGPNRLPTAFSLNGAPCSLR
ncbi:cellulose binding domain-containing protein [Actinosynnema pretiosum]|uniref:Alpha-L-arabinofuranosidase n=1 Tax=Actinosynnema pretiosum TaxID=42197 RepID=A0A290Z3Y2_9PSEU|nr:cellulose binding domain-containing protein [Actinosynnema pretiosum]ATE53663.1 alpha-L-arabinofuranosidase [Actinosynnema pretiosum]